MERKFVDSDIKWNERTSEHRRDGQTWRCARRGKKNRQELCTDLPTGPANVSPEIDLLERREMSRSKGLGMPKPLVTLMRRYLFLFPFRNYFFSLHGCMGYV